MTGVVLKNGMLKWILVGIAAVGSVVALQTQVSHNTTELESKADRAVVEVQLQDIQRQLDRIEDLLR